jgi:hypothetical protein
MWFQNSDLTVAVSIDPSEKTTFILILVTSKRSNRKNEALVLNICTKM